MKKFFLALAALGLMLSACNMNELESVNRSADLINFTVTNGGMTKAVDVTTANLAQFEVTAFNHGTETSPYINAVSYTGGSGTFASATPYYWPEGNLDFYAWSQGAATGDQVSKTNYKTFVVTPSATPASQVDLIFAGRTNIGKGNSTDGAIALNFRHAESKIVVKVKNTAPNLKFVISDWKIGYLDDAGTFTYSGQGGSYNGSTDGRIVDGGSDANALNVSMWSGNTDLDIDNEYVNHLASNVNIAANASETLLDGEMIIVPQAATAASAYQASGDDANQLNGSYVGVKLKILNRDNDAVIYSDGASGTAWAIWPADFNFEPGKKYTFVVDLVGGGYFEENQDASDDLDPILEGAVISFASVTVDDFSSQEAIPVPDPANGHAYVDLGLRSGGNKILFATMNIGASSPEEYGDLFAWGETSKRYTRIDWDNYSYYDQWEGYYYPIIGGTFGNNNDPFWDGSAYTKYNATDNKLILDAEDDVATNMWGSNWRIPTGQELNYLMDNCTRQRISDFNHTGISGYLFTGEGDYSGNSIFIPQAGWGSSSDVVGVGVSCYLMSNQIRIWASNPYYGEIQALRLDGDPMLDYSYRYVGISVRPVLVIPE